MYLRYSIDGGPHNIVRISTFKFHSAIRGINIYSASIKIGYLNYCDQCDEISELENVYHTYTMELLTPIIDDSQNDEIIYASYPACNYTQTNNIFSCQIFNIATDCETGICNNSLLTSYSHEQLICGIPNSTGIDDNSNDTSNLRNKGEKAVNKASSFYISITPNPFIDQFKIEWSENDFPERISLYDASGRLINNWEQNELQGHTSLFLKSNQFPPGLYFIKISSLNSSEVVKIIKQ